MEAAPGAATAPRPGEPGSDVAMRAVMWFAALCAAPTLGRYALDRALARRAGHEPRPADVVHPLQREHPPLPQLVADLRRLEAELTRVETSDAPAKAQRMRALALAYDDVLAECCRALRLPPPATRPLTGWDRVQTQLELARHGLTW